MNQFETPRGYVRLDETSYQKLTDHHLETGFCIITAFRSEYTYSENRRRNKQLAADLREHNLGFIKITGGFIEKIGPDNENWDMIEELPDDDGLKEMVVTEESFLIPNYDISSHDEFEDFEDLENFIIELGEKYNQDAVLICPPHSNGNAYFAITNPRLGNVGDVDMRFDSMGLASVTDVYFTNLAKTKKMLNRKRKDGVGGVKFESKRYVCGLVDEPSHTISGKRIMENSGAIPVFGSHYYANSTLNNKKSSVASKNESSEHNEDQNLTRKIRRQMDEMDRYVENYLRNGRRNND